MARYVDAEIIEKTLWNLLRGYRHTKEICAVKNCILEIEETPTADVQEVKHGEWRYNRGQAPGEPLYYCSLCIDGGSDWGKDNFCPHCGAKMDGGNK